jgi:hypothetical protein
VSDRRLLEYPERSHATRVLSERGHILRSASFAEGTPTLRAPMVRPRRGGLRGPRIAALIVVAVAGFSGHEA